MAQFDLILFLPEGEVVPSNLALIKRITQRAKVNTAVAVPS